MKLVTVTAEIFMRHVTDLVCTQLIGGVLKLVNTIPNSRDGKWREGLIRLIYPSNDLSPHIDFHDLAEQCFVNKEVKDMVNIVKQPIKSGVESKLL
jgi:hypothetical protein